MSIQSMHPVCVGVHACHVCVHVCLLKYMYMGMYSYSMHMHLHIPVFYMSVVGLLLSTTLTHQ